ncbi:MAG: hypothetical protein ABMA13_20420 [Chthoniobacteraceae bacterium]
MQPNRDDSIARLLEKMEAKLQTSLKTEEALRKFGFTDFEERRAELRGAIELLRRALVDDSLAEDARIEAFRVQANETRAGAIWMLTAPTHLRDPLLRERLRTQNPKIDEDLDTMLEMLDEARGLALGMLPIDDVNQLREQGFLRPGE